jgi:hypothetical protein
VNTDSPEPRWLARLVQMGKVAGALASILGIIFLLLPRLKPEPVGKLAVTLSDLKVYVRKFDTSEWAIVHFTAQIEGYQGTSFAETAPFSSSP